VALDNLKDLSSHFMILGILLFCMIAFVVGFMYNNNPSGLGDDADEHFVDTFSKLENQLLESPDSSDSLLNITSTTNPEASQLGSRDIVTTSFAAKGSATNYWESGKQLISWVFTGTLGKMLLSVFGGLIGLISYFAITKHIRTGV